MPSPAPLPGAVRRVRKRLADGSIKVYEYTTAPKTRVRATMAADSLRELLAAYERSPEWRGMAPRTRKNKLIALRHLRPIYHLSVAGLKRRDLLTLRDAIAEGIGPGAANGFASAMAALLSWARDRGWIEASPADRIKAIPGGHFPTWSEDALTLALGKVAEPVRRALILAVHTGQRRGDLCLARWSDFRGGAWRVRQEKSRGKTALVIPLHPDLAAELETWRKDASAVTVLTQEDGTPWERDSLTMCIMRAVTPLGLKGHNIHGLRKLAAVRLAEAGCSAHEIASITGHKSLAQVELYTAAVDQERLAKGAVVRLQAVSNNRKKLPD